MKRPHQFKPRWQPLSWWQPLVGTLLLPAPLLGAGLAWSQAQQLEVPSAGLSEPLRPDPAQLINRPPARFDASLDALVRDGVVTPSERSRIRSGGGTTPFNVPAHQQACRSGALSDQECRTGLVVRWGTRSSRYPSSADGIERLGADGRPLPPLTVPVSALLSGAGGTFRLADVFGVTPRPAPLLGNGNQRLLFPLVGSASASRPQALRAGPAGWSPWSSQRRQGTPPPRPSSRTFSNI